MGSAFVGKQLVIQHEEIGLLALLWKFLYLIMLDSQLLALCTYVCGHTCAQAENCTYEEWITTFLQVKA